MPGRMQHKYRYLIRNFIQYVFIRMLLFIQKIVVITHTYDSTAVSNLLFLLECSQAHFDVCEAFASGQISKL